MAGVSVFTAPPHWGFLGLALERRFDLGWQGFLMNLYARARKQPESPSAFSPTVPGAGPWGFCCFCLFG